MSKRMETDPRQQIQSPSIGATNIGTGSIVTDLPADVKALRALRSERHIPVADIVEVVSSIYPRFDRYLLSKVEHGDEYGIRLRDDAQRELLTHFRAAQDRARARRRPNRSKPRRVSCRLTNRAYELLQRELERAGVTMQSWLEALIARALLNHGEVNDP